jgi:hypothetical protein
VAGGRKSTEVRTDVRGEENLADGLLTFMFEMNRRSLRQ